MHESAPVATDGHDEASPRTINQRGTER